MIETNNAAHLGENHQSKTLVKEDILVQIAWSLCPYDFLQKEWSRNMLCYCGEIFKLIFCLDNCHVQTPSFLKKNPPQLFRINLIVKYKCLLLV